jgi:hypothetical protein
LATVYEAAIEPSLWPQAVADTSRAFEAPHIMLGVLNRRGSEVMRVATQNAAEVSMARYSTVETNPGVAFVALTPPTTVTLRDTFVSDSDLERSSFYQDAMRPLDSWHVAIMNVHRDEVHLAPMGISRTRRQRPFGEAELRGLRALAPHLNRALRVTLRLKEMEARASALAEMSDRALAAIGSPTPSAASLRRTASRAPFSRKAMGSPYAVACCAPRAATTTPNLCAFFSRPRDPASCR